jgi:VIT1/CCC1 family predicted Fe2+/Mn2+ transporter
MKSTPLLDGFIYSSRRALEPKDRIAEILLGLIVAITYTGSLSVGDAGRDDTRRMLLGALGCNLAGGVIDGLMFLMGRLSDRGNAIRALLAVRQSADPREAHGLIAALLPPLVTATLGPAEYEAMRQKMLLMPAPPSHSRLGGKDWLGALAVLLWMFVITLPVAVPFIFMHEVSRAMRFSNAIAIVLLFLAGCAFGRITKYPAWLAGLAMVAIGCVLVFVTIMCGG